MGNLPVHLAARKGEWQAVMLISRKRPHGLLQADAQGNNPIVRFAQTRMPKYMIEDLRDMFRVYVDGTKALKTEYLGQNSSMAKENEELKIALWMLSTTTRLSKRKIHR